MKKYNPGQIEKKWQEYWATNKTFVATENSDKEKKFILVEFPFPSGEGLHMGHLRSYTAADVLSRYLRMQGKEVMYPLGWDAFGLPAENFALKKGAHPSISTAQNIANIKKQCQKIGYSFDWEREINTTDPSFYKWTQWIFLQLYKAGLAYEATGLINWCPKDKTGLANEEVINGHCERCGTKVEKKELRQWYLKITDYSEKLLEGLKNLPEWPEAVKLQQQNWIGKSEGAEIDFYLDFKKEPSVNGYVDAIGKKAHLKVFTTRPDTIFGATFLVIAPEHPWVTLAVDDNHEVLENKDELKNYLQSVRDKTEIERTAEGKEKTGLELKGVKAINPANGEELPIFVADYVLGNYGTGAIMAVPAHDERDFEFAAKYNLQVKYVVMPSITDETNPPRNGKETKIRQTVHAIVYDPAKDKYLTLKWKKFPWHTIVLGGVYDGEDVIDAALREIKEETGYTDIVYKQILGGPIEAKYFAAHKDENRTAHTTGIYFELQSEAQEELSQEEKDAFDIEWIDRETFFTKTMTNSELPFWRKRLLDSDTIYSGEGTLINSGDFTGQNSKEALPKMAAKFGELTTRYKLRDWVFSRQRYWGEPIPLVHCEKDGIVAVPDDQLPVTLPQVEKYQPTGTGESPLASIDEWVNTTCPKCGGPAKRETNTMPQWAGSSWYFLRYTDAHNDKEFAAPDKMKYWLPVDVYFGGMEHTTLHLLYSRFWNIFLHDKGLVPVSEPYMRRVPHGMILAEGGEKMSKSKGNVINPDELVEKHGADAVRMYELFLGPHEASVSWNDKGIVGVSRFLDRVWNWVGKVKQTDVDSEEVLHALNQLIKKITDDIEGYRYNTAVAAFMTFHNEIKDSAVSTDAVKTFLRLLYPFAPHIAEELFEQLAGEGSLQNQPWPNFDESKLVNTRVIIVVQVNGKVRDSFESEVGVSEEEATKIATSLPKIQTISNESEPKRVIYVRDKLINLIY